MFIKTIHRAMELLTGSWSHELTGLRWINKVCGETKTPLLTLNLYALSKEINTPACNRFNILLFKNSKQGFCFSLNNGSNSSGNSKLDST